METPKIILVPEASCITSYGGKLKASGHECKGTLGHIGRNLLDRGEEIFETSACIVHSSSAAATKTAERLSALSRVRHLVCSKRLEDVSRYSPALRPGFAEVDLEGFIVGEVEELRIPDLKIILVIAGRQLVNFINENNTGLPAVLDGQNYARRLSALQFTHP